PDVRPPQDWAAVRLSSGSRSRVRPFTPSPPRLHFFGPFNSPCTARCDRGGACGEPAWPTTRRPGFCLVSSMPVNHPDLIRSAIANLVCGLLDVGSGPGRLILLSKTGVPVATLTFSRPAFGPAANGICIANEIISDDNAVGGVIGGKAVAVDGDGNVVF